MRNLICIFTFFIFTISSIHSQDEYKIPEPVLVELNRIEETYNVLESVSQKIWPNWKNFKDFPFLLSFENGLKVFVGNNTPPNTFVKLTYLKVANKSVYVDTSKLNNKVINQPLVCGGRIIRFGKQGKQVKTLNMRLTSAKKVNDEWPIEAYGESRILVYIHELFHCYAFDNIPMYYGDLLLNPDENYALYSEIEGKSLSMAVLSQSKDSTITYIKDFLAAREMKYLPLKEFQRNSELCNELKEGLAEYAELKTLIELPLNYSSLKSIKNDHFYNSFKSRKKLYNKYLNRLDSISSDSFNSGIKNYDYGAFQAILLDRIYIDWKELMKKENYLSKILEEKTNFDKTDKDKIVSGFIARYESEKLVVNHFQKIKKRNDLYRKMKSTKGFTFVINFKEIDEYLIELPDKKIESYKLGDVFLYPKGIGMIKVDNIRLEIPIIPVEINRLYHLKFIDSSIIESKKYDLVYKKKVGDIYFNVTIQNNLFKLTAPKVKLKETGSRLKIFILSRI